MISTCLLIFHSNSLPLFVGSGNYLLLIDWSINLPPQLMHTYWFKCTHTKWKILTQGNRPRFAASAPIKVSSPSSLFENCSLWRVRTYALTVRDWSSGSRWTCAQDEYTQSYTFRYPRRFSHVSHYLSAYTWIITPFVYFTLLPVHPAYVQRFVEVIQTVERLKFQRSENRIARCC